MKHKFFQGAALIFLIAIAAPYLAFADHNPIKTNVFDPTILGGPLLICVGAQGLGGTSIPSNCSNICDLVAQIANVLYFMIAVVIWIIVPITVAVGGIFIMLGGANPSMVERGKKTITGAVIGLVIILCAWLIVYTFIQAFGNLGKYVGGFPGGPASCSVAAVTSPAGGNGSGGGSGGTSSNGSGGASSSNPFGGGGDSGGAGATGGF